MDKVVIVRESIVKVVRMLAEKNVDVTQRGTRAYVMYNSKGEPVKVNVPYIPDDASEEVLNAIQGFIDHEVGHILHSDFKVLRKAGEEGVKQLHNIIEDAFIEKKQTVLFAGSGYNLSNVGKFFLTNFTDKKIKELPKEAEGFLMVPAIRAWSGQRVFIDYMDDKWHMLDRIVPKIKHLIPEFAKVDSSEAGLKLAIKMRDALDAREPTPPPPPEKKTSKAGESELARGEDEAEKERREAAAKEAVEAAAAGEDPAAKPEPSEAPPGAMAGPATGEGEGTGAGAKPSAEELEGAAAGPGEGEGEEGKPSAEALEDAARAGEGGSEDTGDEMTSDDYKLLDTEETHAGEEAVGDEEGRDDDDMDVLDEGAEGVGELDDSASGKPKDPEDADETAKSTMPSGYSPGGESLLDGLMGGMGADFDDEVSKLISEKSIEDARGSDYLIYTKDFDKIETLKVDGGDWRDHYLKAQSDEVDHMLGPMQKDIERAFAARSASIMVPGYRSGRLHSTGLARLMTGDDRVFRRKHINDSKSVAVGVLVDASGSMSGPKVHIASRCAYGIASVLDRMNITNEVMAFTTQGMIPGLPTWGREGADEIKDELAKLEEVGKTYARLENIWMPILKSFNERMTVEVKKRFAYLPIGVDLRENVDGECVQIAGQRLQSRRETRKILMVWSDGSPACPGDSGAQRLHLKNVVKKLEKEGVEVIGVGIQTRSVETFYKKRVVINEVNQLGSVVMKEIKSILMR